MRFHEDGTLPEDGSLLVFGSNLAGRHGKGAALVASRFFGAKYGVGQGLQGRSFAILTKDENLRVLALDDIAEYVKKFKRFAKTHPQCHWFVTRVGCGLAGYSDRKIAPLFANIPNCSFAKEWLPYLKTKT